MRVLAVVLLILLSGCTLPGDEEEKPEPIFGTCPQWITDGTTMVGDATVDEATELLFVPEDNGTAVLSFQGHPLDMYLLRVNATAPVTLRAFHHEDGRRLLLMEEVSSKFESKPSATVDGESEIQAFLTAVVHGTPAAAGTLLIVLEPTGAPAQVGLEVLPFYRVCGIAANPADSRP